MIIMEGMKKNEEEYCSSNGSNNSECGDSDVDDTIDYGELIETHYLQLVQNLDVERQYLLGYLRSKLILDNEDCERIRASNTTQGKVSKFLDIIKQKGMKGMKHFIEALQGERPELYKDITGKEPNTKASDTSGWTNSSDVDHMILADRLEKVHGELHMLTKVHKKVLEEKSMLEKKLFEMENNNRNYRVENEELKNHIEKLMDCKRAIEEGMENSDQQKHQSQTIQTDFKSLCRLNALQQKLLESSEENKHLIEELKEVKEKEEQLNAQLSKMKAKFDKERRTSKILNEKIMNHTVENCKDMRDLRLHNSMLLEENDEIKKHLGDFQKYSGVLNVKYNVMSLEMSQLKEHTEKMSFSYDDVEDKMNELHFKCEMLQYDKDFKKVENARLKNDVECYLSYQKTLMCEFAKTRDERMGALNALKVANDELLNVKKSYDESMHNQLIFTSQLNMKYKDTCEQLQQMRDCLEQTKYQLIETQKKLRPAVRDSTAAGGQRKSSLLLNLHESVCNSLDKTKIEERTTCEEVEREEGEPQDNTESGQFRVGSPLQRRSKELLESLRRKALQDEPVTPSKTSRSLSRLTHEQMGWIFPTADNSDDDIFTKSLPGKYTKNARSISHPETYDICSPSPHAQNDSKRRSSSVSRTLPCTFSKSFPSYVSIDQLLMSSNMTLPRNSASSIESETETSLPQEQAKPTNCKEKRLSFKNNAALVNNDGGDDPVSPTEELEPKIEHQFLQNIITKSPRHDYPPAKIHTVQNNNLAKLRTTSSTSLLLDTFFRPVVQDSSISGDASEEGGFRERLTGHVDMNDKSKWSERKRSLSCPRSRHMIIQPQGNTNNLFK